MERGNSDLNLSNFIPHLDPLDFGLISMAIVSAKLNVTRLEMSGSGLSSSFLYDIGNLAKSCLTLCFLDLSNNPNFLGSVKDSSVTTSQVLFFDRKSKNNKLSEDGRSFFSGILSRTKKGELISLNLSQTGLDDFFAPQVITLIKGGVLSSLDISQNSFSSEASSGILVAAAEYGLSSLFMNGNKIDLQTKESDLQREKEKERKRVEDLEEIVKNKNDGLERERKNVLEVKDKYSAIESALRTEILEKKEKIELIESQLKKRELEVEKN